MAGSLTAKTRNRIFDYCKRDRSFGKVTKIDDVKGDMKLRVSCLFIADMMLSSQFVPFIEFIEAFDECVAFSVIIDKDRKLRLEIY